MFWSPTLAFVILVSSIGAAQLGPIPTATPGTDSLAIGKQALAHGDYKAAQEFFSKYLKDEPEDTEAIFYAGNSALGLLQYDDAASFYRKVIEKNSSSVWPAHKNLVIVYAAQKKWDDFDHERKLIQDARAQASPGLSPKDADVIEIFYVGDERYIVRAYAELAGHFHARYNFTHFKDGKLDFWISCESDDADQTSFAQSHPNEAAAGQRSFSLDSYTAAVANPNGQGMTQTHGTIKFYPDGEPTYETVRADVLKVLEHRSGTMSKSTINTKPNTK